MSPRPRLQTLLAAAALAVAAPPCAQAQLPPLPAAHSLWFDAGALLNDQVRAGAEVLRLGRFTAGLAIAYSTKPHPRDQVYYPIAYAADNSPLPQCDPRMLSLCAYPYYFGYADATRYRAWAFDLAVRYYPEPLAFRNGDTRMMVYAGAYAGYHWRRWDESPIYYAYPLGVREDSIVPLPGYPVVPYPSTLRHTLKGLEPGMELGVRLLPIGPLFLEAGGRFTLAVVDDPMQRVQQGDVEARLVLTGGIAW
jgi:hypothetical protein